MWQFHFISLKLAITLFKHWFGATKLDEHDYDGVCRNCRIELVSGFCDGFGAISQLLTSD